MEYYAKSATKSLSDDEKSEIVKKIKSAIEIVEDNLTQSEKTAIDNSIDEFINITEKGQVTLKQHLEDIVICAENFFKIYGGYFTDKEKKLVVEACRIHDIGKANIVFQIKIGNRDLHLDETFDYEIPHGYLSAVSISQDELSNMVPDCTVEDFKIFITAVYHHHDREDKWESAQIKEFCKKYYIDNLADFYKREEKKIRAANVNKILFRNNETSVNKRLDNNVWEKYALVKGLLNKFDYTVSSGYDKAEQVSDIDNKILVNNIYSYFKSHNMQFNSMQLYMKENINKNLVVVAPTGMGKTEAALLWADGEKCFYTLPYMVSSNAIYDRIKKTYNYGDVTLLHSGSMQHFIDESRKGEESAYNMYQKAKLLSFPLTVCTVDQIFKFVYKALGTEIFAATLKYSKVIIDEIQSYDSEIIAAIIYGLKIVSDMGGHFAIITATFPPVLRSLMEEYGLIEAVDYEYKDFSTVAENVRHWLDAEYGDINVDKVIEDARDKKVLVICNIISSAQVLYQKICDIYDFWMNEEKTEIHLLHSNFIKQHRRILEENIMSFSRDNSSTGIWITTQIVEASLDIDFDVLYTEMSTVDSLLQRLGRCNRHMRYVPIEANVHIYIAEEINSKGNSVEILNGDDVKSNKKKSISYIYDKDIYNRSVNILKDYTGRPLAEREKNEYINRVYCTEELVDTAYYQNIKKALDNFQIIKEAEYSKQEADRQFRNINSVTIIPDNIYNQNIDFIDNCLKIINDKYIKKDIRSIFTSKISDMTLSLPTYNKYKLPELVDECVIWESGNGDGKNKARQAELNIHRASMDYEFDIDKCTGSGLIKKQTQASIFM